MQLIPTQGMVVAQRVDRADPWHMRVARPARAVVSRDAGRAILYVSHPERSAGNMSSDVRREMLQAGVAVIDHHGAFQRAGLFFPTFETHFSGPSSANETGDQIKQAVVLLLGRAARHLAASDPRISGTDGRVGLTCAARDAHGRGSELAVDRCAVQDTVRRTQVC